MDCNTGWNDDSEREAIKYQHKSWSYSQLHSYNAEIYYDREWKFTIAILLTSISTVFPGLVSSDCTCSCDEMGEQHSKQNIDYISMILLALSSILVTWKQQAAYSKEAQAHDTASSSYTKLSNDIKMMLILPISDRQYAKNYLNWTSQSYSHLVEKGPSIDDNVQTWFIKKYKSSDMVIPDILSTTADIIKLPVDIKVIQDEKDDTLSLSSVIINTAEHHKKPDQESDKENIPEDPNYTRSGTGTYWMRDYELQRFMAGGSDTILEERIIKMK